MRKKYLVKENEGLILTSNRVSAENRSLLKKIDELNIMLGAKDSEIADLKNALKEAENALKEKTVTVPETVETPQKTAEIETPAAPNIIEEYFAENKEKEEPKKTAEETKPEPCVKPKINATILNETEKYAAESIARVAIKTATDSEIISNSESANKGDLLTLLLGKSEVFKTKVYSITAKKLPTKEAKAQIDTLESETFEYFEGLKKQL